jgi:hypothetical protein
MTAATEVSIVRVIVCYMVLCGMVGIIVVSPVLIIKAIKTKSRKCQKERLCPECGKPVGEGKNFCTNCGAKVE